MPNSTRFTRLPISQWFTKKYYVYTLCAVGQGTFYVGKGSGNRMFYHEGAAAAGQDGPKYEAIRRAWRADNHIIKSIIHQTDDEQEAYAVELEAIKHYSRHKSLTNRAGFHQKPTKKLLAYLDPPTDKYTKNVKIEKLLNTLEELYPEYDDDQIRSLKNDIVNRGLMDSIFE